MKIFFLFIFFPMKKKIEKKNWKRKKWGKIRRQILFYCWHLWWTEFGRMLIIFFVVFFGIDWRLISSIEATVLWILSAFGFFLWISSKLPPRWRVFEKYIWMVISIQVALSLWYPQISFKRIMLELLHNPNRKTPPN